LKHPYQYVPFQKGPRICLGMNMAFEEAKCCLVMLYNAGIRFELLENKPEYVATAILSVKNGLKVRVRKQEI